ncbi:MAG: GAF domain-containing protein [Myxococcales bacterium]|nr:GAF domain-containing protein [Myxococcales bacterium]
MAEGIGLPAIERFTLLEEDERVARLEAALPAILAACAGEDDPIALQATVACLLYETLVQSNWCGFYRRVGERTLVVGPYQGSMGCLRIDFGRGVCGKCATTRQTQLVHDVHAFPDHIACDARSRSEVVVPVVRSGELEAVLDIDSPHVGGFSAREAALLERLVRDVLGAGDG